MKLKKEQIEILNKIYKNVYDLGEKIELNSYVYLVNKKLICLKWQKNFPSLYMHDYKLTGEGKRILIQSTGDSSTLICNPCGASFGTLKNPAGTTWHIGVCEKCEGEKAVTEQRDFVK